MSAELKKTLLLVDDEPDARLLASDILGDSYDVTTAESAAQALQILSTKPLDVVLTDIKMPGEDGISLLRKVRAMYPETPVILLTGHGDKQTAIDALKEGAFDFLEKPFEDDELLSAVSRAFSVVELKQKLRSSQARVLESDRLATLGLMAGGIAHEINTPLTTIVVMASSIKEMLQDPSTSHENLSQISDEICNMVMRISKIIKSLQSFARDNSNAPFLDVGVKDILDGVLNLCSKRFSRDGIDLIIDESFTKNYMIQCRDTEIAQVLFNLITNAQDAIREMQEKWVRLECKEVGAELQIVVTDSGKGIPEEIRNKIFHPFFTTKEVGKGTGLGLAVSIGIVEAHHGKIEIDPGSPNTTFIIKLPKVQTQSEKAS